MVGPTRTPPAAESPAAVAAAKNLPLAPRPPNAWILYRSDKLRELPPLGPNEPRRAQADVSRMISMMWKNETEETRTEYERRAEEKKAEHLLKYPNYRFQPMKKEDKALLREQRKQEKEQERRAKQQRARQSASTPSPAIPLPHIYPPMIAGSLYYPMETFGPAGPSPPISVSSSPNPDSSPDSNAPSDDSHVLSIPAATFNQSMPPSSTDPIRYSLPPAPMLYHPQLTPSMAPTIGPSHAHTNPYSAYYGTARHWNQHSTYPPSNADCPPNLYSNSNQADSQGQSSSPMTQTPAAMLSTPNVSDGSSQPILDRENVTSPLPMNTAYVIDDSVQDGDALDSAELQNISFDVDPAMFQAMSGYLASNPMAPANIMDTFLLRTDDPAIFQLPNLDPDILISNPCGELEVSLGQYALNFDFSPYLNLDHDSFDLTSPLLPEDNADLGPLVPPSHFNVPQYIPLDFPPIFSETSITTTPAATNQTVLSTDLSNTNNVYKPSSPYIPPSGAVYSSTRRVAGSWKSSFASHESPIDHSPPRALGVSAS